MEHAPAAAPWADRRPAPRARGVYYRPVWGFDGPARAFLRTQLETCPKPLVHVCCGPSTLGEIRVDRFHPNATVKADALALPFRDVGTILMDPPWNWKPPDRHAVCLQALFALRVEGVFLLYAPWIPSIYALRLEGAWVRAGQRLGYPMNPPIVSRWRKTKRVRVPKRANVKRLYREEE